MFENLCTLPLSAELFTQALHPTEPLLAVGLSTGHVECFRLPAAERSSTDDNDDVSVLSDGKGTIDTVWRTRRHKGSCRTVTFSGDGSALYSSGTDGIVKHFSPTTGQVASKFAIPSPNKNGVDAPTVLHILSPQTMILGCDSGILHLVDLRDHAIAGSKPQQSHYPHMDFVSSISPLPPSEQSTSGFSKQWVSTGGTTLAVTDVRRGVLVRSEDQEDELLSSVFVPGLGPKTNRELGMAAVGGATGVLTLWDKGAWDDQQDRVTVDRGGESLDCVVQIPEIVTGSRKKIAIGVGDGTVRVVDLFKREVEGSFRHDEEEAVLGLGFDCQGRMISGGGKTVKVWQEADAAATGGDDDSDDSDDGDSDDDAGGDPDDGAAGSKEKRQASSDEDSDSDSDGPRKRGKKKRRKGKAAADLGPYGAHGIMKFKGLD